MAGFGTNDQTSNKPKNSKAGAKALESAVAAHKAGDIEKAETLYVKAISLGFHHEIAFSNLGVIYRYTDRHKEAVEAYRKAISISPRFTDAYLNISSLLIELGNLDQALDSTLKYLNLQPDCADGLLNLGIIHKGLGNLNQALDATHKSLQLKPNNPEAHMNLGCIFKDLGKLDQAIASTLKSLQLKPDNPTTYMNLGDIYKDLGNLDQAIASTLKSLQLKPDNPEAHMNLGSLYKDLGNLDQALEATLKSLQFKPDNPDALMNLGGIYKDLGNLDQARASIFKSLELIPNNPETLTNSHIHLGEIYFEIGDYKNAEDEFDLAIGLDNQLNYNTAKGKAACLFIKQDYDAALKLIQELASKKYLWRNNAILREASIKSLVDAKQKKENLYQSTNEAIPTSNLEEDETFIKISHRPVEESLIAELYEINTRKLSQTCDARNGSGFCTDFSLFSNTSPQIKKLEADFINIIRNSLNKEPCSLKYDSFFNIFKAGSGTTPHRHLASQDRKFDLWRHKYSLVYYVDPGDQNCDKPGILRMHEPDIEILPKKEW